MLRAHRVEAVRAAESALMARLPDGELMRRAADGLARAMDHVPAGEVLLVLVGPGDNGGDALFAAARLLDRGVRVDLCLLDASTVHAEGLAAAEAAGARRVDAPAGHRYVLDGLLGIGARPGLTGRAADLARAVRGADVTAVDLPSGVDVETGALPGDHVVATRTISFGTHKIAGLAGPAVVAAGSIPTLVDIGLVDAEFGTPAVEVLTDADGDLLRRHLFTTEVSHKYTRGVVGVAAGSAEYAGAAHLCVAGAQSGPAGMVRFVGEESLRRRVVDAAPEVVGDGRCQSWVVGPGTGEDAAERLAATLERGTPVVIDADALQHVPDAFEVPALLTPHAGELARMLDVERDEVEADPFTHARDAADRWQATVLLKGERTVVASPDHGRPVRVNHTGTPWLGTAGSGDVLAGLAGSLLAAGLDPLDAGSVAAFLHGRAGQRANPGGPFVASDVARGLPVVIADFLRGDV